MERGGGGGDLDQPHLGGETQSEQYFKIFILPGSSVFPGYLLQTPFCTAPAHMENLFAASQSQKSFFVKIDPNLGHENSVLQKLWVMEVNRVLRRGVRDMTRGPGHML